MKANYKNDVMVKVIFFALTILPAMLFAQSDSLLKLNGFQESRNKINQTSMIVLGSWAVGNLLSGTYGNFKAKGEAKYFNQFNACLLYTSRCV